ncbi:carboxylate--amine ligase [Syntrophomonas palmitatica]|uniref:carboxylate--amine ligase n=1 Tax=Syntrophomonas palmitatica TaxID=402877 RepID=UPI0006D07DEF|nr:ATP-grasp enzyme [Syntrophomonas palmitatica]
MIFAERDFIPVMLGNDINVYSLARAFYEAYKVKSTACGKAKSGPACHSKIIEYQAIDNLDQPPVFIRVLNGLADRFADKKLILLGCGDNYVEQIIRNRAQLRENIIAPYVDANMMDALITKESFYEMCDRYWLEYPKTFLYTRDMGEDFDLPFGFPIILKPSNGINYWAHPFASQKKVYKLDNRQDLLKVIEEIYQAGYEDKLIIQDFIPGDDSYMYAMNSFSGRDKKVRLMALGHVILEEHTPHGLGNAAVIISEHDEELSLKIKDFLENIGYEGFASFDIKYDRRDNRFKILEINLRQGRGSYYVTAAGYNLAEYVTEEYIFNQPRNFKIVRNEILWTAIPLPAAFMVIKDQECRANIKRLIKSRKAVNPLFLKGDRGLQRAKFLYRSHLSHYYKFLRYCR